MKNMGNGTRWNKWKMEHDGTNGKWNTMKQMENGTRWNKMENGTWRQICKNRYKMVANSKKPLQNSGKFEKTITKWQPFEITVTK